jgi:hypothetical protein
MANRGWTDSGNNGEQVSSTARTSGVGTDCSDADPFTRGSQIGNPGAEGDTMGARDDLFEAPGQLSTS